MMKELLEGVKSRLKGVGEKTAGGAEVPPAGPPAPPEAKGEAEAPKAGQPSVEDFTSLLGGDDKTELENKINDLDQKTQKLDTQIKQAMEIARKNSERLDSIDNNMKKFLSLYELVTNQINPFVDQKASLKKMLTVQGETVTEPEEEKIIVPPVSELEKEIPTPVEPEPVVPEEEPAIAPQPLKALTHVKEETAAETQPEQVMFMQSIKNGTASFVLEWITSLVGEKADLERNTQLLRYLMNLGWITPKAYTAITKHLEGMAAANKPVEQKTERIKQMIPVAIGSMPLRMQDMLPTPEDAKNGDMKQLVTVLGWVNYLVEKVGAKDTEEIMRYLVELDWLTPEAHKSLLNYIQSAGYTVKAKTPPVNAIQRVTETLGVKPAEPKYMRPPQMQPAPAEHKPKTPDRGFMMPPFEAERSKKTDIQEIIPLNALEDDLESLAIILEWVRHFYAKAGGERSMQIFNYYRDIGWITPKVNQVIVKYIDSIKTPGEPPSNYQPNTDDHAATLYFISKLKKKTLTEEDARYILT